MGRTYNSRNGKVVFLSVFKETEHVVTDDDTALAGQLVEETHCDKKD